MNRQEKLQYCYSLPGGKDGAPPVCSADFRERKEKKRRMCYNWCNQFMQSFFMSGIGKRLPGEIREAQGRQRKHIPFSDPLFA